MVCFSAGGVRYAIPVDATLAVRPSAGLVELPGCRPGVVGVLPGDPVLSVISPLAAGAGAAHVVVVTTTGHDYGLLVDAVTEVCTFDDMGIHPAPAGQQHDLIVGVAERSGGLVLITDPDALAARL